MDIHPKLNDISDCLYRLAVKAVIIQDHKILLVKSAGDEWWSLPGGGIDHGETIEAALERELYEELGLNHESIMPNPTILFVTAGAVIDGIPKANIFYRVLVNAKDIKLTPDSTDFKWVTAKELADLYLSPATGPIKDRLAACIP